MNMMRMSFALWVFVLALPLTAAGADDRSAADTTISTSAGEEKEICTGAKATIKEGPKYGTLRMTGDPSKEEPVHVFYKAAEAATAVSEKLTCATGSGERKLTIEVVPKGRNNTTGFSDEVYPEAFKALFLLLAVATVLESALAILFNWRPFVETLNARAVRPVVSLAASLFLVFQFKLDVVTGLAKLISPQVPALDWSGKILTAMVLAGGSAAVNHLMVSLGFRQLRTPENTTPKPPTGKGWISVRIVRSELIKGPVTVCIGVDSGTGVPVVASLDNSTRAKLRYFLRDRGRFPAWGGYAMKTGDKVTVKVRAAREDGTGHIEDEWGPEVIGEGAIIDLKFTI
ncbi:hypothetical protein C1O66_12785 [Paucibacter aquatile]|uniref:Uncharacterized protein n=1 Tax=Kinneretia aquatilis TaxID=2070761 RepID=A0A2N8KY36_9BURK|nr:hypothetical protein [Paucibacter aquatile]PND38312.1 hypothetical protein C1O66_12785 [Paucibacter aquatile]